MSPFRQLSDLVRPDVPIGPLTTYKLGGPAAYFAEVGSHEDLSRVVEAWRATDLPLLVVGRGSNLVVADEGVHALVVRLAGRFGTIVHEPDAVWAGSAVRLPQLARAAVAEGRLGLEFFVGIPGSVGGAVRQNAGGHGRETRDVLIDATVLDATTGTVSRRTVDQLDMGYRRSAIARHEVVTDARFSFEPGERGDGEARMREITRWRREHQPGGTLNAGSVFKNPPGDSAGRIVDALGLKGTRVGDVAVSDKHANFFVAGPDATAADLRRLVDTIRSEVEAQTGVRLEVEIQFEGFE
ncbi:MAG TPA: UDP-N-acetylmuramate dehydrogenase [Acidimicrobiia bacterium]|nr:UDP-N-acetylmuramate dehydrogenase [Acidimicrobiia bacterium]